MYMIYNIYVCVYVCMYVCKYLYKLSWWLSGKRIPPANAGETGFIPQRLGRSPEKLNGNPLQYSCMGNAMDSGARQAAVHGVTRV